MRRPNILHIFADMQRADTIAALGNPVIKTPNLDRLCREGIAFTNAFSPSPVCVSARCSMIFGQYPHHTKCYENAAMPTDERKTFMSLLSEQGYRTHGIGKCHFTPDRYDLRGFGSREVQEEGGCSVDDLGRNHYLAYLKDQGYDYICEPHGIRGENYYIPQPSQLPQKDHPTQWVGDRSESFIHEVGKSRSSWYLFSSFIHPHPPFTPPNPWHKLYRAADMPLPLIPPDSDRLITYINRVQNRFKHRDRGVDLNLIRLIKAYYYACISFVDFQIGRLIAALEATGQYNNTLILFSSDHGELLGDYGSWGKRSMHNASARIPLIIRQPGRFDGGLTCAEPASLVDIAPTFAGAAEQKQDKEVFDGLDLADVVRGNHSRTYVFGQTAFTGAMGRTVQGDRYVQDVEPGSREEIAAYSSYMCVSKEWKYIYSAPDAREFLFDRVNDPEETHNKKGSANQALHKHKHALLEHLRAGGETGGIDGEDWWQFRVRDIDPDPDTGHLIQDNYTPWAEMNIPGYTDT